VVLFNFNLDESLLKLRVFTPHIAVTIGKVLQSSFTRECRYTKCARWFSYLFNIKIAHALHKNNEKRKNKKYTVIQST